MKAENPSAFSRLGHAISENLLALHDQKALLWRPKGAIPDFFSPKNSCIIHSFLPDILAYRRAGYRVFEDIEAAKTLAHDARVGAVYLSPSRALNDEMIAQALEFSAPGATIIVEGTKENGIGAQLSKARSLGFAVQSWAKFHGKLFWFEKNTPENTAPAPDWPLRVHKPPKGAVTRAGIFSAEHIDPGTRLLSHHIKELSGAVCDLGAGWGYLADVALRAPAVKKIDLVEAEKRALDASRENITDARANFLWADALDFEASPYDYVISNPPFHDNGRNCLELGRGFIRTAARILKPKGHFLMVANRHLAYEKTLHGQFHEVKELDCRDGYKIIKASFPRINRQ